MNWFWKMVLGLLFVIVFGFVMTWNDLYHLQDKEQPDMIWINYKGMELLITRPPYVEQEKTMSNVIDITPYLKYKGPWIGPQERHVVATIDTGDEIVKVLDDGTHYFVKRPTRMGVI